MMQFLKKPWVGNILILSIIIFGGGGLYRNDVLYHQNPFALTHTIPGKTVTILDHQIRPVGTKGALSFYLWVQDSTTKKFMQPVSSTAYQVLNIGDTFQLPDERETDGIWTIGIIALIIFVLDHFIMLLRKHV